MSRRIYAGGLPIGGGAPVVVQSMTNTDTRDVEASTGQIERLVAAGCGLVRLAVPDMQAAAALGEIKKRVNVPLCADIHFDFRLALASLEAGADKIRINPGNIGGEPNIRAVANECKARGVPIRVGVNGGSVDRDIRERCGVGPQALCESAKRNISALEACGFDDICVSVKASGVADTIEANRMLSRMTRHPIHLGVTEAGTEYIGIIKSASAIAPLLLEGIGDTVRVSLTADPVREVKAAIGILKAIGLNSCGANIISCPTCGRTQVDLLPIARQIEDRLAGLKTKLDVAVMGCAVNGPGEAREADIGVACGKGEGLIISKGEIVCKVPEDAIVDRLIGEIEMMTGERL